MHMCGCAHVHTQTHMVHYGDKLPKELSAYLIHFSGHLPEEGSFSGIQ